jgi:hypothetical protein
MLLSTDVSYAGLGLNLLLHAYPITPPPANATISR